MRKIKDCYEQTDWINKPFYEKSTFYVNEFTVEVNCFEKHFCISRLEQHLELHNCDTDVKYRRIKLDKDVKHQP